MENISLPDSQIISDLGLYEKYKLGTINSVTKLEPSSLNIPEGIAPEVAYHVEVEDPYVKAFDPEMVATVEMHEDMVNTYARRRRIAGKWQRAVGTAYIDDDGEEHTKQEWGDPVSHQKVYGELDSQGLYAWNSLIPSAIALTYLSDPLAPDFIKDAKGNVICEFDPMARLWLSANTDARAIRNRGTIMADIVKSYILDGGVDANQLKWMSVACGTALPAMKAAVHAGITPELTLVDFDHDSMNATEDLAMEIGFMGEITKHRINIFDAGQMAKLRTFLGDNGDRPRIIDLMGIFEYTGNDLGVDPASFLRSNYDMLHPGGKLIFGQMRADRPRPDFTMGVVRWPYVAMRSPAEVMKIIQQAGIDTKTTKLYLPNDGVYTICEIEKPLGNEAFAVAA